MTCHATDGLPPTVLAQALADYERGRIPSAYVHLGEARHWPAFRDIPTLILCGRVAHQIGSDHLGDFLHTRAYRLGPQDARAAHYHTYGVLRHRGPVLALAHLDRIAGLSRPDPAEEAHFHCQRSLCLSMVRDFAAAEAACAQAVAVAPDDPWALLELNSLLARQDRPDAALAGSTGLVARFPTYRPILTDHVHLLAVARRLDEAVAAAQEAEARIDHAGLVLQRAALHEELAQFAEMREALLKAGNLLPRMEPHYRRWWQGRLADACWRLGLTDEAAALAHAAGGDDPRSFFSRLAPRLADPAQQRHRVLLPVPAVRQDHNTCGPATLTSIARAWGVAVEHLHVVEAICYDGTSDHAERRWAEDNGFVAREFLVDWDTARALLDRGCPFSLVTAGTERGHLQAVAGYDAGRGTLLIRDPGRWLLAEYDGPGLLTDQRAYGPRGMLLVPKAEASRLEGIVLPEMELYDSLHVLRRALADHDRATAADALAALESAAPGHRLTLTGRWNLCAYDGDTPGEVAALTELARLFPDCLRYRLSRDMRSRAIMPIESLLTRLAEGTTAADASPFLLRELARELLPDSREEPRVRRLLERALRRLGTDALCLAALADLARRGADADSCLRLGRWAACLEQADEWYAARYARDAAAFGRAEEGLTLLRERQRRLGPRSSAPGRTLHVILRELDRDSEAEILLESLLTQHPGDGDLLQYACRQHLWRNDQERSAALRESTRGRCPPGAWARLEVEWAERWGDRDAAIAALRPALATEPLALDLHRHLARLCLDRHGLDAALVEVERACAAWPYHLDLQEWACSWLGRRDPAAAIAHLESLVTRHPGSAWAWRELAWRQLRAAQPAAAGAAAERSWAIDPASPAACGLRATLAQRRGDAAAATSARQQGLTQDIAYSWLLEQAFSACSSHAQQEATLALVAGEIRRQGRSGGAVAIWHHQLCLSAEPTAVLAAVRELLAARKDLWELHVALIQQLVAMDQPVTALSAAEAAIAAFPLLPRLRLEEAAAARAAGDRTRERRSLEEALRQSPTWTTALLELANLHELAGRHAEAEPLIQTALGHDPQHAPCHGYLGMGRERAGRRRDAQASYRHAVDLDPHYGWGWDQLERLDPADAVACARRQCRERPGDAEAWLRLSGLLWDRDPTEALACTDRVLAGEPGHVWARDRRAALLSRLGRHDEALACCADALLVPLPLRRRRALILWNQGSLSAAADELRAVLTEEPMDAVARRQLAEVLLAEGNHEAADSEATRLLELHPRSAEAAACCALVARAREQTARHLELLERASALEPRQEALAFRLIDAALDAQQPATALPGLERLLAVSRDPWRYHAAIRVRLAADGYTLACEHLQELFEDAGSTPQVYEHAAALFAARDALPMVWELVDARAARLDTPAAAFAYGARNLAQLPYRRASRELRGRMAGPLGRATLAGWLDRTAETRQAAVIRRAVAQFRVDIDQDTFCWGKAGYALNCIGAWDVLLDLGSSWDRRPDIEGWMLRNLTEARLCRRRGSDRARLTEAAVLARACLDRDGSWQLCRGVLGLELALRGEDEAADRERSAMGEPHDPDGIENLLKDCISLAIDRQPRSAALAAQAISRRYDRAARSVRDHIGYATVFSLALGKAQARHGGWPLRWRRLLLSRWWLCF